MIISYSGKSAISAELLAEQLDEAVLTRKSGGDINWGRSQANTKLNADTSKTTNKRIMRKLFEEHGVPIPKLCTITSSVNINRYPVIGRPDYHSKGRGLWKCYNHADVRKALQGTSKKKAATHFMEYIDAPREYRVHIFMGKSIRISEKLFGSQGTTSAGSYTTIKPSHDVSHVRAAAKQAMLAVGLDFGAVDVLANDTECWVLECNSAPHLGGTLPKLYASKFNKWYERSADE